MPKSAARIWRLVTDVRVERIQDITEADALAEGVEQVNGDWRNYGNTGGAYWYNPRASYRSLWNSLYPGSWDANIGVWRIGLAELKEKA
jgi:hypothetical protein